MDIKEHANPQQVLIIRASPLTREPFLGERFARGLALKISVRPPANLSQTRIKFSRGRRNARLGAPLMSASSKAKTMLTAVLSSETNQNYTVTPSCLKILLLIIPRKANRKTVLRTHFEVSVPRIGEIHLTKMKGLHFKGFLLGDTIEAPRLVVTYLDFAPPAASPTSIVWN